MKNQMEKFLREEDGLGTVEIVLLLAALVGVAILFKNKLTEWIEATLGKVFGDADAGL